MKKKIKILISTFITTVLLIAELSILSDTLGAKASVIKYHEFFSTKQNYDVLFLGSSHVIDGIFPMEIWNDYGITSYNLGGHSNTIPTSYWVLKNALDYTQPKVVVIDGYLIGSPYKISGDNYSSAHTSFDAFPLTKTKIEGVLDLLNDEKAEEDIENGIIIVNEKRTPIGLLWDYSVYHSRWDELTQSDFEVGYGCNKGAEDRIGIVPHDIYLDDSVEEVNTIGVEYLDKICEECNSRGIDVVLVYLPSRNGTQAQANWLCQYAQDKGLKSINFMSSDCIDPQYDFSDSRGHLNPSGAKKVSAYLGDFLAQNYQLENQKADDGYNAWNQDFGKYLEHKIELLKSQKDINLYFMLLCDSSFKCNIRATSDFINNYNDIIQNINALGCVSVEDSTNQLEEVEIVGAVPEAIIEVLYDNEVVDCVYFCNGTIYRQ